MTTFSKRVTILMANDSEDVCFLTKEALTAIHFDCNFKTVKHGEELLDYLYHRHSYANLDLWPNPDLILLDFNMPRMNGKEALEAIKSDFDLCHIPVIMFTTSDNEQEVLNTYKAGVNSYVVKPVTFEKLVEAIQVIVRYWFGLTRLPRNYSRK